MKISTEIDSIALQIGEEKAVELVAKTGFDAWDFSMFQMCKKENGVLVPTDHPLAKDNYLAFARKLKQIGLDNGIICNQGHAPFPSSPKSKDWLKRAIECLAEAGGEILIVHPMNNGTPKENAEMYFELLPFAKEHGVKIATENMWNWDHEKEQAAAAACSSAENFCAHLDTVNDDYFIACLDIGHAEMRGLDTSAVEMIAALGKRLQALHVHDNDQWHDLHQIPFSLNVDFEAIINALKKIGYSGDITLEAGTFLRDYTAENVFEGVKLLAQSARKIADRF